MIKIFMNMYRKPSVERLLREEFDELQRALYLEDKRADHHRAQATAIEARMKKIAEGLDRTRE